MIYDIKIEQKALMYIKHVLSQRPYSEVASILTGLDNQQNQQDIQQATTIQEVFAQKEMS